MENKQYYIDEYNKRWRECQEKVGKEEAFCMSATELFDDTATAEENAGYYLDFYGKDALMCWAGNLEYSYKRWKTITDLDFETTVILTELCDNLKTEKYVVKVYLDGVLWDESRVNCLAEAESHKRYFEDSKNSIFDRVNQDALEQFFEAKNISRSNAEEIVVKAEIVPIVIELIKTRQNRGGLKR